MVLFISRESSSNVSFQGFLHLICTVSFFSRSLIMICRDQLMIINPLLSTVSYIVYWLATVIHYSIIYGID